MKKHIALPALVITLLLFAWILPVTPTAAAEKICRPSSAALIAHAKEYDGTEIQFRGEAIGDVLVRGSGAWVNVSDGSNSAIGVYMSAKDAQTISVLGKYDEKGDTLLVTGTFHRACAEHGGDMDLHASRVQIVEKGHAFTSVIPSWLYPLSVISAVCAFCLCAVTFFRIRSTMKAKKAAEKAAEGETSNEDK